MDLTGKKVAVYGLGVSGKATLIFLQDFALGSLLVVNRGAPESWGTDINGILDTFSCPINCLAEESQITASELSQSELIILSPGIARESTTLGMALQMGVSIWNELELAAQMCETPLLAVTGTNGKTTCVTFMGEVLKEAGCDPFIGGNIGRPFLDGLKERSDFGVILLEVSSFQCESLETFHPKVAGILNIFPNHGERYADVESYRKSKWLLTQNQDSTDTVLTGPGVGDDPFSSKSKKRDLTSCAEIELKANFDLSKLKLVGKHNRWNLGFCWEFLSAACPVLPCDEETLKASFQKVISQFKGVEHRLEFFKETERFAIFNDAKSTNWQATLTALEAVKEKELPIVLILGGQLRGHNDLPPEEFCEWVDNNHVTVLTMGESGKFLMDQGLSYHYLEDLQKICYFLRKDHMKKQTILFSPAFPSFDQFANYGVRGKRFKEIFECLN